MFEELDKPLKYVIFVILYIEIVSFMFNPKIKIQMLICVLVLTAIASISFVYDMHKGIGEPNTKISGLSTGITGSFVKLLPPIIQEQNVSAPIGWFVGFIATMNLIAMTFITKIEYDSTPARKLSNKNKKKLNSVKGVFISIVVSVVLMSIINYFLFYITIDPFQIFNQTIYLSTFKNANALMFLSAYAFGASVYTLHESRMLYKLFVNDLIAN